MRGAVLAAVVAAGGTVVSCQFSVASAMADAVGQVGGASSNTVTKAGPKAAEVKISPGLAEAQAAYRAGRFNEAEELEKKLSDGDKYSLAGLVLKGKLDLSAWRLKEATQTLVQARRLAPTDKEAARLLAEAYMRADKYHEAAVAYGAAADDERSDQAQSFAGEEPYHVEGLGNAIRVRLLRVDPVPVVAVRVNGGEVVYFLLDTGGGQTVIDKELARTLKLTTFGAEPGTFGGGEPGGGPVTPVVYARVSTLAIGLWVLHDVPVILKSVSGSGGAGNSAAATGNGAGGAGGESYKISGVIGTELLYHFFSTVDFGGRELILRRKIPQVVGPLRTQLEGERAAAIPFRMVGDHYMLADGTVNGVGPMPFFVDTGLAGYGAAKIVVSDQFSVVSVMPNAAAQAAGAGESQGNSKGEGAEKSKGEAQVDAGKSTAAGVTMIPFTVETLTLGPLTRRNLAGIAGPLPATLEKSTGVKIGGLIAQAFFRPYAVTFDFEAATLWVVASGVGAQ
jgi:hypothetical protein